MIDEVPSNEDVMRNFDALDTDGSGTLDKKEVYTYLKGFEIGA